jgi:hypothetical protein
VFGSAAQAEWIGEVKFDLLLSNNTDAGLPYGTGQGTIDVSIIDPHWRTAGMRQLQIEARVSLPEPFANKPDKYVKFVKFTVVSSISGENVYVGVENGSPYCIFGEVSGSKTCATLKAGDTWPQSQKPLETNPRKKEADTSIARTAIATGTYELRIQVKTEGDGEWNAFGDFTLLP